MVLDVEDLTPKNLTPLENSGGSPAPIPPGSSPVAPLPVRNKRTFILATVFFALLLAAVIGVVWHFYRNYRTVATIVSPPPKVVSVTVLKRDSLSKIFVRENLNPLDAKKVLDLAVAKKAIQLMRPGNVLQFQINEHNAWLSFSYPVSNTDTLVVVNDTKGLIAKVDHVDPESHLEYVAATVHGASFAMAAQRAGLDASLIKQLRTIFQNQIDFKRGIKEGDKFDLLYSVQFLRGKPISGKQIMAAEFSNNSKVYKAFHFTDNQGHTDYYDQQGLSLKPSFVRAPFKYTRISSLFSLHRFNPVLHVFRAHLGVDFAGKIGTPVKATGAGRIAFMGVKGGYGNVTIVQHDKRYSTLYAHLSRFPKGMHIGSNVAQGQVIGYLGESGLATGPHVHYEFRSYGVHFDPLKVKLPFITYVNQNSRRQFFALAHTLLTALNSHHNVQFAFNTSSPKKA